MFPLAGQSFPTCSEELASAIRDALAEVFELPDRNGAVRIEGGSWPSVDQLTVNLSDAVVRATRLPPRPEPTGPREPGVTFGQIRVMGHPIRHGGSRLDLDLNAQGVRCDFARDAGGRPLLVLADAREGRIELAVAREDIRSLLLEAATAAAKPHGVQVQDLHIQLAGEGPRAVAGEVRVKAKKMIMSGVVTLRGRVSVSDELVATFTNLACTGEGVVGSMAAAMIGSKLKSAEGMSVPLTAFSAGDMKLRDVQISTGDRVRVTADFGRPSSA